MKSKTPAVIIAIIGVVALAAGLWWMSRNGFDSRALAGMGSAGLITVGFICFISLPRPDLRTPKDLEAALDLLTFHDAKPIWMLIITQRTIAAGLLSEDAEPYTVLYSPSAIPLKSPVKTIKLDVPQGINRHSTFTLALLNLDAIAETLALCDPTGHVVIEDSGRGQHATYAKQAKQIRVPAKGVLKR